MDKEIKKIFSSISTTKIETEINLKVYSLFSLIFSLPNNYSFLAHILSLYCNFSINCPCGF